MTRLEKVLARGLVLPITTAAAFCLSSSTPAKADSLTLLAEYGINATVSCSDSSTPTASCGTPYQTFAQSTGSLATGTVGILAQFPLSGLPLPTGPNYISVYAEAFATLQYDFVVDVPSQSIDTTLNGGMAVFTLTVDGATSVSNTLAFVPGVPATCSMVNCQAGATIEIPDSSGEAFVGLPGKLNYSLANIKNSGNATGPYTVQVSAPVNNGGVDFDVTLEALAICPSLTAMQRAEGESCSAVADYLDPFTIAGASVYGANGDLISDATLVSQTGYIPGTPEPSSLLLLGSGVSLLGLGWTRMKLKRS